MKKKKKSKGAGGDGRRQVTNLRESPYSVKDGDIVAIVDKMEDPQGQADLTRAEDEVMIIDGCDRHYYYDHFGEYDGGFDDYDHFVDCDDDCNDHFDD